MNTAVSNIPARFAILMLRENLRAGRCTRLKVQSCSMQPLICKGSVVTVAPISKGLRVGDIVIFERGGLAIVHRLVARRRQNRLFIEKGDDVDTFGHFPYGGTLGKVVEIDGEVVSDRCRAVFVSYGIAKASLLSAAFAEKVQAIFSKVHARYAQVFADLIVSGGRGAVRRLVRILLEIEHARRAA